MALNPVEEDVDDDDDGYGEYEDPAALLTTGVSVYKETVKLENRSVSRTNTKLTYHVEDSEVWRNSTVSKSSELCTSLK